MARKKGADRKGRPYDRSAEKQNWFQRLFGNTKKNAEPLETNQGPIPYSLEQQETQNNLPDQEDDENFLGI